MSVRLRNAIIRMRPPGGAWHTIATSIAGTSAVAVGAVTISWGQPTPRDHPAPGSITFTLLVPDGSLDEAILAYDTEVIIEAELDVWDGAWGPWRQYILDVGWIYTRPLARGWLTRWTRGNRRRHDGRRAYSVTCLDVLGRAAATKLAAAPWPASHDPAQRVAAINAASPAGPLLAPGSYVTSEAYDVDNAAALDVIHRHCPIAFAACETVTGITTYRRPNKNPRYAGQELQFSALGGVGLVPVQADMIEDTGREMDRTSVVSDVGVTAYWASETQRRTVTYRDPSAAYSSSRYTVDTDERIINSAEVASWANALISESRTAVRRIPPGHRVRLGLERVNAGLADLFVLGPRSTARILDIIDAPPDLDALQYVQGGTLTIAGLDMRLVLDTSPARLFGTRTMRYADLPRDARRPRIRGTNQVLGPLTWKTRISETHAVSFAPWPDPYDYT